MTRFSYKSEAAGARALKWTAPALLIAAMVAINSPAARAAALWIADSNNARIVEYQASELGVTHTPTGLSVPIGSAPYGACFDKSNNLWVADSAEQILEFSETSLSKLPTAPSPLVTITSSSFVDIDGCAFDKHGDLWVADYKNDSVDEISAAQLRAGSGSITPAVIITDTAQIASAQLSFVTFDKKGNLWTDSLTDDELFEFSASQLSSGGNKTAAVVLGGGGALSDPGQIAFDGHGNLWVSSPDADTVVMFPKSDLSTSNNNAPSITLSSADFDQPWGLAFRGSDLWVVNFTGGSALEFVPKQLKSGGTTTPKVILTGAAAANSWEIIFGPKLGKQE